MICDHLWTYRNGRSECIKPGCNAIANDKRGLPRHWWAVNGEAIKATLLQSDYACAVCLSNIRVRMVDGETRPLCDGAIAHDIGELARAITKVRRDGLMQKQEQEASEVLDGLPAELRALIEGGL